MNPMTRNCIALRPTGNLQGIQNFFPKHIESNKYEEGRTCGCARPSYNSSELLVFKIYIYISVCKRTIITQQ